VGETGARIDSFAQVPDATSEFAAQNLGGPIFATHAHFLLSRDGVERYPQFLWISRLTL
jgi:hypothetical protein